VEGGAGLGASAALLRGVRWDYSRAGIRGIRMRSTCNKVLFFGARRGWRGEGAGLA
jgi:hypothetical protein